MVASADSVTITSGQMLVDTATGLTVTGTLQTPRLQNELDNNAGLTIESIGQDLSLSATRGITFSSTSDDLSFFAAGTIDISTTTSTGAFTVDSATVLLTSLATNGVGEQLCVCGDGRLYTVAATLLCSSFTCL